MFRLVKSARSGEVFWNPFLRIAVLLCGLAGAGAMLIFFVWHDRKSAIQTEMEELRESLTRSAKTTDQTLADVDLLLTEDARQMVTVHATGKDIHSPAVVSGFRETLIRQTASLPALISMSIFDENGKWTISSRFDVLPPVPSNSKRPFWTAALRTPSSRSFVLGENDSPVFGVPSIVVGRSVRASDGQILGCILGFPSRQVILSDFTALAEGGAEIMLNHPNGGNILGSSAIPRDVPAWLLPQWLRSLSQGGGTFLIRDPNGRNWIVVVSGTQDAPVIYTALKPAGIALLKRRPFELSVLVTSGVSILVALVLFGLWFRQSWLTFREANRSREDLLRTLVVEPKTRFLNRVGLLEELMRRVSVRPVVIHTIGVERFETITHTLGHEAEEDILAQFAGRVNSVIGEMDVAAHLSGYQFAIAQYTGNPEAMADALLHSLGGPYESGHRHLVFGISVGIVAASSSDDWAKLLQDSSTAMLRAREHGRGRFQWFEPEFDRALQERLSLELDLQAAIGTDELYMVYQPIYHFEARQICGFEALMRWNHPTRGAIPPGVFIPIAERAGLLLPIEQMVQRSPLAAAALWPAHLYVSINCPAAEFQDVNFPARIAQMLACNGLSPDRCCLEITESSLLADDQTVAANMRHLKQIGMKLALDDFGTGHASLSYLHRFPFDRLKIDQSFVHAMDSAPVASAIVEATLTLCRRLDIEVVAEGVETREQLQQLEALGCACAQGYLIGRPMREEEISSFLLRTSYGSDFQSRR